MLYGENTYVTILVVISTLTNQQYILKKVSLNTNSYKTKLCLDQLMITLRPEACTNLSLYFFEEKCFSVHEFNVGSDIIEYYHYEQWEHIAETPCLNALMFFLSECIVFLFSICIILSFKKNLFYIHSCIYSEETDLDRRIDG